MKKFCLFTVYIIKYKFSFSFVLAIADVIVLMHFYHLTTSKSSKIFKTVIAKFQDMLLTLSFCTEEICSSDKILGNLIQFNSLLFNTNQLWKKVKERGMYMVN